MKENTKQLALCFCLRPDHSTLLELLNALQLPRLSVFNMEGPPSVCKRCLKDSGVVENWQIGRKLLDGRASYKIPQKMWFPFNLSSWGRTKTRPTPGPTLKQPFWDYAGEQMLEMH